MKIDCCGMACPEPVLKTKKALDGLKNDDIIDVVLNSTASIENVKRLATNSGYQCSQESIVDGKTVLTIVKGYACSVSDESKAEILNKTILVKDDKLGEGELGSMLIAGLLKNMLEFDQLPKNIVFVNKGILLTTQQENADTIHALKEFEARGTKVYSCGMCFEFYGIDTAELKVGEIGNAYDTAGMMLHTEVVSL